MATKLQILGDKGEELVRSKIDCPKCKRSKRSLRTLPRNFRCADLICDFCGYLAQVKSVTVDDLGKMPKSILGAAWEPQRERMEAGIFFTLFIVLMPSRSKEPAHIYYLSADLQTNEMFVSRNPLSSTARRAGWQGYMIDLSKAVAQPARLI
jgi:hypothetical protein